MTKIDPLKASFNAGELSPRLHARLDFTKYPAGLELCKNLIPLPEGGLTRRPATRFVAEIADSNKRAELFSFEATAEQHHVLELGDNIIRFYFRQGQQVVLDTDAVITNGTFPSNITDWDDRSTGGGSITHDATNGRLNLIPGGTADTDIGWAEQDVAAADLNQETVIKFQVIGDPGDKIEFQVGSSSSGSEIFSPVEKLVGFHCVAFTPTASPFYIQFRNVGINANKTIQIDNVSIIDNLALEIGSPYIEAQLSQIMGTQSNDVKYLFRSGVAPYKLERRALASWSLVRVAWQDGPYITQNSEATTLTPAATSGVAVTVTASSIIGINGGRGFLATDVGRLIRIDNGAAWGWGIIIGRTNTLIVDVHVKKAFAATSATADWRLGAWSDTTGWPKTGGFFEQRLYVASTDDQSQTLWGSQTGDFENFKPDDDNNVVEDDDALDFTLSADSVGEIRWLSAGEDTLAIGTAGGEWVPSASGIVITPLDITIRRQTTHGSALIAPLRVDHVVLFVQKAKRKIREFVFNFEFDSFLAPDITRLAQHITVSGVGRMAFQQEPDSLVWAVRTDGRLLSLTFRRDEDVVGWAQHDIGGAGSTGAEASFTITGGSDGDIGQNAITSITVGGEELLARAVDFDTDPDTTAVSILSTVVTQELISATEAPRVAAVSFTNSDPEGSFASVTVTVPSHVASQVLIAQIGRTDGAISPFQEGDITPAEEGWSAIFENQRSTGYNNTSAQCNVNGIVMSMYWRIATDNEPSNYTWNYDTVNSPHAIGAIYTIDRNHTTLPINDAVLSFISTCDTPNPNDRTFKIEPPTALTDNSLTIIALAVGEVFLSAGTPYGSDWEENISAFKGPIPTSLHLLNHSQNGVFPNTLDAGQQWNTGEVVHSQMEPTDNLINNAVVCVAISISPPYIEIPAPLVNAGVGSANYTVTVSGTKITITANNSDFGEGGENVVVTTTGDMTVDDNTFSMESTGVAFSESIVSIAGFDGAGQVQNSEDRDEVWVTVKRTINGVTKRYVEFLEGYYDNLLHDQEDAYYADSIITYDGVSTTTITGLSHLEGETVRVWGDGAILPDVVVSNGQVILSTAVKVAQIGLAYNHRLETLKVEGGNPAGTALGKKKRINSITFVLLNSHTLTFGSDDNNKFEKDFRLVSSPMDAGVPLFTGEQNYGFDGGLAPDTRIIVESDDPAPFTLLAMVPEVKVNPSK